MAENFTIRQTVDLSGINPNWNAVRHDALMYPGDNLAHTWKVQVKRNGIPVDMTGGNVVGYFQRKDGNTVMVDGTIEDSICKVTMAQECYAIPGAMKAVMRYTDTSTHTIVTLAYHAFTVQGRIDDGGIIDPGEVIPSIDDLLAEIEAMEQATAAAEAAATKSVRYDSAQTLTDAQKEQARGNIDAASDDDVADLKSTLVSDIASATTFEHGGINGTTGANADADNMARCDYIYVDSAVKVSIDHDVHTTYRIYVYYYNASKTYQGTSGLEYDYTLTDFNGYIRVALRDTDVSTLTDEDIAALKAALHIERNNATESIEELRDDVAEINTALTTVGNNKFVRYDTAQSLTDTQKGTSRENIGAASTQQISDIEDTLIEDVSADFVLGGINGTTGKENDEVTNYARSGYIYVDSSVRVHIDHTGHPEYHIYVYYYDYDKVYKGTSGIEYDYSLENFNGFIRVCLRNTDKSTLTSEDIATLKAALHIDRNNASASIEGLRTGLRDANSEIDARIEYGVDTQKPYNLLSGTVFQADKYVDFNTGEIKATSSGECASDYIPVDPAQGYICKNTDVYDFSYNVANQTYHQTYDNSFTRYQFAFYDIDKTFIPYTGVNTNTSAAIPENARYIRVTLTNAAAIKTARLIYGNYDSKPKMRQVAAELKPSELYAYRANTGYESFNMVMFGDSITHGDLFIDNDGVSYVDYAGDFLGANIMNVGFGGTRMALAPNQSISDAYLFAFFNLCDVIVSDSANKWDALDAFISTNATYGPHLARLKAIDWNTVHAIGIMYGANDYMSSTPVGTAYNTDYHNFDGACAYGLDKLLTKYPHLQVIIFTPFYRQPTDGDIATDTDNATNSAGLSMMDYGKSLRNVSDVVHCPVIDTYHTIQVNKYNKPLLMRDGTHPRTTLACKRMGQYFAEQIKQYIFPLI